MKLPLPMSKTKRREYLYYLKRRYRTPKTSLVGLIRRALDEIVAEERAKEKATKEIQRIFRKNHIGIKS